MTVSAAAVVLTLALWLASGRASLTKSARNVTVEVHDLHATMLHVLGLNHEKLSYFHQGRDFRLTDVFGKVMPELLA